MRLLQQDGLEVEVVMTRHAQEFITPLTFAALTGRKVITEMFSADDAAPANVESAIEHIAVAQRIDALVIAPATANTIAKLAQGISDDFLSTLALATTAPVIIAPAMNVNMWEHAATRENIETLRARSVRIVSPDEGYLACGMVGAGRLAGIEAIAAAVRETLGIKHDLVSGNSSGYRRAYLRRRGPCALSDESLLGEDGLRARGCRPPPRRARDSGQRPNSPKTARWC